MRKVFGKKWNTRTKQRTIAMRRSEKKTGNRRKKKRREEKKQASKPETLNPHFSDALQTREQRNGLMLTRTEPYYTLSETIFHLKASQQSPLFMPFWQFLLVLLVFSFELMLFSPFFGKLWYNLQQIDEWHDENQYKVLQQWFVRIVSEPFSADSTKRRGRRIRIMIISSGSTNKPQNRHIQ